MHKPRLAYDSNEWNTKFNSGSTIVVVAVIELAIVVVVVVIALVLVIVVEVVVAVMVIVMRIVIVVAVVRRPQRLGI